MVLPSRLQLTLPRLVLLVVAVAVLCTVVATWAFITKMPEGPMPGASLVRVWMDTWGRWDGGWYKRIATEGYRYTPGQQSAVAFFPLYPLFMRAVVALGVVIPLAGMVLTYVFGLCAVIIFWLWAKAVTEPKGQAQEGAADFAALLLILYPFAFYLYGAVYSDALFLLLVTSAFLALEKEKPGWATLLGVLAATTRPLAPALVVGLGVRSLERRRSLGLPLRVRDYLPLLSGVGLLLYMGFLWYRFGDPFVFAHVQGAPGWDQAPGLRTWLKYDYFASFDNPRLALRLTMHALVTVIGLSTVFYLGRNVGWGYAAYVAVALAIPALSSKNFQGMGRYAIAAFPVFLAAALLLKQRPRLQWAYVSVSVVMLLMLTWLFGAGEYVS